MNEERVVTIEEILIVYGETWSGGAQAGGAVLAM
jgi:hypothetical protein